MEGMQICFIQFLGCTYLEGKSVYCIVLYSSIHDEKKKLLVPLWEKIKIPSTEETRIIDVLNVCKLQMKVSDIICLIKICR